MTSFQSPSGGPGDGLFPTNTTFIATNRSGADATLGQHFTLDLALNGTEVDNNTPGSSDADGNNSGLNNFVDPVLTADRVNGIYVIAMEAIADNSAGLVGLRGRLTCAVASATVAGDSMTPATTSELTVSLTSSELPILAIALEADTSNLALCLFDGLNKFGTDVV